MSTKRTRAYLLPLKVMTLGFTSLRTPLKSVERSIVTHLVGSTNPNAPTEDPPPFLLALFLVVPLEFAAVGSDLGSGELTGSSRSLQLVLSSSDSSLSVDAASLAPSEKAES